MCCAALIAPLWVTDWLPLVDLPQHAAQLAIAKRWSAGGFDYASYFELNWFANSILPYAISYLFATVFPILVAIKLVLCLSLLGIPLVTVRLVAAAGGNRWWVFATFPVAYGYAFAWGFYSFVFAAPLGLLLIDAAIRYRARPTGRRAWLLVGLCYALFASHVLVLAYTGLVALAIIGVGTTTWRARLYGALALASVIPLTVAWWVATKLLTPGSTPQAAPFVLDYGLHRFATLMTSMIGADRITLATVAPGLAFCAVPFLLGCRAARERWRAAPLAITLVFHLLLPLNLLGTAFVAPRFSLFLIPSLLIALEPSGRRPRLARAVPVVIALSWLAIETHRFHASASSPGRSRS